MGLLGLLEGKQALLFVNKKKQKNFDFLMWLRTVGHTREAEQKFFWFFFFKKKNFFLLSKQSTSSTTTPFLGNAKKYFYI
jgi:hypothetical protein